ncbi:MAG: PaaI family thioesterase [Pseudomonadota bacterium]
MSDDSAPVNAYGGSTGTVLDYFPKPPCASLLGYEFVSFDRERQMMRVRFTGTPAMLNPAGSIQGGFLTAMLDDVMGSMLVVLTNGEKGPISVDLHTQFLWPAKPGLITGEARVRHMTNSTAFTEASLTSEDGDLIATAIQTQRLFPVRKQR